MNLSRRAPVFVLVSGWKLRLMGLHLRKIPTLRCCITYFRMNIWDPVASWPSVAHLSGFPFYAPRIFLLRIFEIEIIF